MRKTHSYIVIKCMVLVLFLPIIAACASAPTEPEVVRETVVVTAEPDDAQIETVEVTPTPGEAAEAEPAPEDEPTTTEPPAAGSEPYTTPHPILSDINVRQAIAYCTNRLELIESVYPYLTEDEQQDLLMDTFLPPGHWALADTDQITAYPFDPAQGQQLLEEAGWTLDANADVRINAEGEVLALQFLTTNAQFRETWAAVFEQQMLENCGIQIIRTHAPGSYVFGTTTGLQRRQFELGAFAWVGDADPGGSTLYACDQIPLPSNNWEGQNYMGWCNEEASRAIIAANSTLDREERAEQYGIVQREFTADMVSLPLFNRLTVAAASNNLLNYRPDPTEYHTANVYEWELADGGDTLVIGMTQEPETLFSVINTTATFAMIEYLFGLSGATQYSYEYQTVALTQIPTLENGGATLEEVEVQEGDMVFTLDGEIIELAPGLDVRNADGDIVTYEGDQITMSKLSVTFEYVDGITWSDGEPLTQEDFELGARISCDPEVGRTSYTLCDSRERIEFESDTRYTIHYVPGALWPEYSLYSIAFYYPAHQVLGDGRNLADVPASEWAGLEEIATQPLALGPYRLVEWQKGQRMVFEANPYYYGEGPAVENIIISFVPDSNQAVAQLLNGNIDVLSKFDLEAGATTQTVLEAAEEEQLQAFKIASPTWEHIDMNLFIR